MQQPQKKKKTIYVGGLDTNVTEEILYAAFIPFGEFLAQETYLSISLLKIHLSGDLREVNIPKDYAESTSLMFEKYRV